MADPTPAAWKRVATELAARLPGEWATGGRAMKLVLGRRPVEWTLLWVGISRTRRDDPPHVMAGTRSLVSPFGALGLQHGRRSDSGPGSPGRVDLTASDAVDVVERFVTDIVLPLVEPWTDERQAADAEDQLATPEQDRSGWWADAAGWRVVLDTGSPVPVAEQALADAERWGSADDAAWYRGLISAWESGGREPALAYLRERRDETLARLGLAD